MSRFMRAMKWLGLTHDEEVIDPLKYERQTSVNHSVHMGEGVKFEVTAVRHEHAFPIFVIKVKTSDNQVGIDFFTDSREHYTKVRDNMRLTETVHESYSSQPKVTTWMQRLRSDAFDRFTPSEDVWGPFNMEDE